MSQIHISGVGALGAFVLWELNRRDIVFTWDDLDSPFNAWRVSTGSISPYPRDDQSLYAKGYRFWRDYVVPHPEYAEVDGLFEGTTVLYALKRPPKGRKMDALYDLGGGYTLWKDPAPGYQLNVQQFVERTRAVFAIRRLDGTPTRLPILQCRGVGNVDTYALWGWQAPVQLTPRPNVLWPTVRPAFHFADPRLPRNSFYFLPIPGYANYWWVGSDIVLQRAPRSEEARAHDRLQEFKVHAEHLLGSLMEFAYVNGSVSQGWRPIRRLRSAPMDRCVETSPGSGVWIAPPLNRTGIQCGPLVARWIADQLFGARS